MDKAVLFSARWGWLVAVLGLSGAAAARDESPPAPAARPDAGLEAPAVPRALLEGVVTERDLDLLLAHARAALLAAARGTPPPPSEALNRRAEEIANALQARGTLAALLLLDALEARARQRLRELQRPALPPGYPHAPGAI